VVGFRSRICPGHQHALILDAVFEQFFLGRHCVAAEQVGDVDFLKIVDLHPSCGQIREIRHAAHVQREALEKAQNFPSPRAG
jgi:hypothetical protein